MRICERETAWVVMGKGLLALEHFSTRISSGISIGRHLIGLQRILAVFILDFLEVRGAQLEFVEDFVQLGLEGFLVVGLRGDDVVSR